MVSNSPNRQPAGGPEGQGRKPAAPASPWSQFRTPRFWITLLVLLGINIFITNVLFAPSQPKSVTISYTEFKQQVTADNVVSVTTTGDAIQGVTRKPVTEGKDSATRFNTERPVFADAGVEALLEDHHVTVNSKQAQTPFWQTLLLSFGPVLLIIIGFLYLSRRAAAAGGGLLSSFGQSKARLYDSDRPGTTFADVAGIDEVKAELQEVVDFLKEPQKYQRLGGTVPKGVLLVGPPGTGKTLLARAVAGEAGVPFFSIAASEFIEAIVGVGAARVRDLFAKARAAAPAIIFIDELDAIGRSRSAGIRLGGNDEQEQSLNQILTEMDGFDNREGVIVIAATNRADVLDQALLRPGRFDRRVAVQPPDRRGRAAILRIHTRNVPLGPDVDLELIAGQTPGLVGADLHNLVNEAALAGARKGESAVSMVDFTDAIEKTLLGSERKLMLSDQDREKIAYHESGHALLGLLIPGADPVRKVTIIPRGMALGVTVQSPVDDRFNYSEEYLLGRIIGALGGRAAERLLYGEVTTGAQNDLEQVTHLAHEMVVRWGMSRSIGPVSYSEDASSGLGLQRPYSEATAKLIDDEVKRIAEECERRAEQLLKEHRPQLDDLARALLKNDSLNEEEILEVTRITPPVAAAGGQQGAQTTGRGSGAHPHPAGIKEVAAETEDGRIARGGVGDVEERPVA